MNINSAEIGRVVGHAYYEIGRTFSDKTVQICKDRKYFVTAIKSGKEEGEYIIIDTLNKLKSSHKNFEQQSYDLLDNLEKEVCPNDFVN